MKARGQVSGMTVGRTESLARAKRIQVGLRAHETQPRRGGARPPHAYATLSVLCHAEEQRELCVLRSWGRSSKLRFRAPRLCRWRRGRKAALRLARKASTAAQCGRWPHRPRQCLNSSGLSFLAHVASRYVGFYAAQQAAAPDRAPLLCPGLKPLVRRETHGVTPVAVRLVRLQHSRGNRRAALGRARVGARTGERHGRSADLSFRPD